MNEQIPPEFYDTEEKPERKKEMQQEKKEITFSQAFLWPIGILLGIFYLLALIGGFLK